MKAIIERVKNEPALALGLVGALIALALSFGLELTSEQQGAIMAVVVALLAVLTRSQVTPTRQVGALEDNVGGPAGDLMAGPASDVRTGDPVDVIAKDELGAYDSTGLLVALACIVIIICGLVWLIR